MKTETRTWTELKNRCISCGGMFRISEEAIDLTLQQFPDWPREKCAHAMDVCLGCATGQKVEGEIEDETEEYFVNDRWGYSQLWNADD